MPRLLLLPLLLLALAACADPGGADLAAIGSSSTPATGPTAPADTGQPTSSTPDPAGGATDTAGDQAYVGLTEQEALAKAEAEGRRARVTSRDGESFPQTMDLVPDRLNLVVEDGKVVRVSRG